MNTAKINISRVFLLGLMLSFALGLNYLHAWTAPTQAPPNGNVAAPINTSATLQGKSGGLTLGSSLDVGSTITVGGVPGTGPYLIDMDAATPGALMGIRFPDGTVQTTAATTSTSSSGLSTLNGQNGAIQTFATTTSAGGWSITSSNNVHTLNIPATAAPGTLSMEDYLFVRQQAAAGTQPQAIGTSWTTRTLNTVVVNTISGASLASNQITLPTGTYYIRAIAEGYSVGTTRARLYSVTGAAVEMYGTTARSARDNDRSSISSYITGTFTVSGASETFRIEQRAGDAANGEARGGYESGWATEYYTPVEIWKTN